MSDICEWQYLAKRRNVFVCVMFMQKPRKQTFLGGVFVYESQIPAEKTGRLTTNDVPRQNLQICI